jgi:hypothetical protein
MLDRHRAGHSSCRSALFLVRSKMGGASRAGRFPLRSAVRLWELLPAPLHLAHELFGPLGAGLWLGAQGKFPQNGTSPLSFPATCPFGYIVCALLSCQYGAALALVPSLVMAHFCVAILLLVSTTRSFPCAVLRNELPEELRLMSGLGLQEHLPVFGGLIHIVGLTSTPDEAATRGGNCVCISR